MFIPGPGEQVAETHLPYTPIEYHIHDRHCEEDLSHLLCLIGCRPGIKGKNYKSVI